MVEASYTHAVNTWLAQHKDQVIQWRRHIHRHPELSNHEYATTDFLVETLTAHGLHPVRLQNTGLYVDIGPDTPEKLAFRADIDALPLVEVTGLDFASVNPGVCHACGHDVHTTVALALACALSTVELKVGLRVIFQPAEEVIDGGATDVIAQGVLDGVGAIYSVHVEPKLQVGRIGVRTGAITSATDVLTVEIAGAGGHSSRPHMTQDVVYAVGSVITQLPALLSRRVDPRTGTVLVFGHVESGSAPNAIPQRGLIRGTVRTADIGVWRDIEPLVRELVAQIVEPTGCRAEVTYTRGVPPVLNDEVATVILADAASLIDPGAVVEAPQSSGGEDFSWYLEKVPGSMARLGAWSGEGAQQDLHQGDLLVDERAIGVGVRLFAGVVEKFHQRLGE